MNRERIAREARYHHRSLRPQHPRVVCPQPAGGQRAQLSVLALGQLANAEAVARVLWLWREKLLVPALFRQLEQATRGAQRLVARVNEDHHLRPKKNGHRHYNWIF